MKGTLTKKQQAEWGRIGAHITSVSADLWDDEPEILDLVVAAERHSTRRRTAGLLLADVLYTIRRMSPAELGAFLVGVYARRKAYCRDEEARLKGRAA